jgi:hypothetical protein
MKTTGFLKKDFFDFEILAQLFNRPKNRKKSESFEDLKEEITASEYLKKVKFLIKQDLLLRYSKETIEKGLENFVIQISAESPSQSEVVKKKEVSVQEQSTPVENKKEFYKEEKQQDIMRVVEEDPEVIQEQPTPGVKINEILTDEKKQEVWKVHSRVPKWFRKPHQINSRILIAYLDLLGENKSVPLHKLESACRSIKTFQNNYVQMKSFGERNHAKVFEESGGRVTLWEPVREFVKQEFKNFKKRNNYY